MYKHWNEKLKIKKSEDEHPKLSEDRHVQALGCVYEYGYSILSQTQTLETIADSQICAL